MARRKKIAATILIAASLLIAELAAFYIWTLLFMVEGQPARHGDPQLQHWALICVIAAPVMLIVAATLLAYVWTRSEQPTLDLTRRCS